MSKPLKILHLEDLPEDAYLVARALKKGGVSCEVLHVENEAEFKNALKNFLPDIILSDHSLPSFDSHEALRIVKAEGLAIPFILVTATVSEEYAVSIIKEGAADYILKDRLQRLPSAVASAMEKFTLEQSRKIADETLRVSERKYKLLFESNPMPMWMLSRSSLNIIAVNEAAINHYGYSRNEFLTLNARDLVPPEELFKYLRYLDTESSANTNQGIWKHRKKDGTIIMVEIMAHDVVYENNSASLVLANDITEKLKAEEALTEQRIHHQKLMMETSIRVQERERDEIGKELHDNINQILAAARLFADMALRNTVEPEAIKKTKEHITLAISEIRKLSHTLATPSLGTVTLAQAVNELFMDIREATSMEMKYNAAGYDETAVDRNISLMLFRIMQEQVNNIIKHARAKKVMVKITMEHGRIFLTIQDDGIGFDSTKTTGGIGLRNIRNRVECYDGTIRMISSPGNGCIFEISIPVQTTDIPESRRKII
jgi:PAS domain S-box-containing protein